jgi:hypothetical protein
MVLSNKQRGFFFCPENTSQCLFRFRIPKQERGRADNFEKQRI